MKREELFINTNGNVHAMNAGNFKRVSELSFCGYDQDDYTETEPINGVIYVYPKNARGWRKEAYEKYISDQRKAANKYS